MKKNFFLNFAIKNKIFYKPYLFYNIYIRNFKHLLQKSHSQFGEDIFLLKYFNKRKGFFIDLGCHHPFRYNNTFKLYKLGWRGINIDLNQISIDLFDFMRPKDHNLCFAISDKIENLKYYVPNKNLISPEITTDYNFTKKYKKLHGSNYHSFVTKSVNWSFLEKYYRKLLKKIDLLKIDIEGSDLKVLKSINLKSIKPKLIMIEAPDFEKIKRKNITKYLKIKKYKIIYDNKLNIIYERN